MDGKEIKPRNNGKWPDTKDPYAKISEKDNYNFWAINIADGI